jgi:propanol-preferring alcohol dehydrogenase
VTLNQAKMPALRLLRWQSEPVLVPVRIPEPGPGEVLLKVEAAGLCHSDLHLMEWPAGTMPYTLPFTLGHETAGTVVATGPGATLGPGTKGAREGDRMLVYARWGCGACWPCLQGMENLCETAAGDLGGHGGGVGRDGGLAEYMVVPSARYLVPIGDLDPVAAAPLTDAALTSYHAIKRWLPALGPGATAVVIGIGGLGHMAVQLLRAVSNARVVAVDIRDSARRLALEAGAHAAVSGVVGPGPLREEAGGRGAALVLDCVATDGTLALAAGVIAPGGAISYVGRGGGSLPVSPASLPFGCSVHIPTWGTLPELAEVVALAQTGAVRTEVECFALGQAVDAYRRLRRGEVRGRAVVTPDAGYAPDVASVDGHACREDLPLTLT